MSKIFLILPKFGINHNGDIELAKKLIDMAANCGFDAVKFQKNYRKKFIQKKFLTNIEKVLGGSTQREQKFGLEFEKKEYDEIDKFCKDKIKWFASAWDVQSLEFLDKYDLEYAKVASAMIVDINF